MTEDRFGIGIFAAKGVFFKPVRGGCNFARMSYAVPHIIKGWEVRQKAATCSPQCVGVNEIS